MQSKTDQTWPLEEWLTEPSEILERLQTLDFTPGSQLFGNFFFRKYIWELTQLQKIKQQWPGGIDESDWLSRVDLIREHLQLIARSGIKGGRLVVAPFEITLDGEQFDWTAMDTAIELMAEVDLEVQLSLGPLNFPFGPYGVRLPSQLATELDQAFAFSNHHEITISLRPDRHFPQISQRIKKFALDYIDHLITRYGQDTRVTRFYVSNEWPDAHSIEGVREGTSLVVAKDLMLEILRRVKASTSTPIGLNTNIPPYHSRQLKHIFGEAFDILADQGFLGFDPYPTQEAQQTDLAREMPHYGDHIQKVRELFPQIEIGFTEYQAEPWPPNTIAGQAWSHILQHHPDIFHQFYQLRFPSTIEPYLIASQSTSIGMYGTQAMSIAAQMGYTFPLDMIRTITQSAVQRVKPIPQP